MIGNDIVDLNEAARKSNPFRTGFMKKVYSPEEQEEIMQSSNPLRQVWILWAMKESAYKAHQRRFNLPTRLNLLPYHCKIENQNSASASGVVYCGEYKYYTYCSINPDYIHCTATGIQQQEIIFNVGSSSEAIKEDLLIKLSELKMFSRKELNYQKDENFIPHIFFQNRNLGLSFSLSHHGRFAAFGLSLMNY